MDVAKVRRSSLPLAVKKSGRPEERKCTLALAKAEPALPKALIHSGVQWVIGFLHASTELLKWLQEMSNTKMGSTKNMFPPSNIKSINITVYSNPDLILFRWDFIKIHLAEEAKKR